MATWAEDCCAFIGRLHNDLAPDATLKERKELLRKSAWRFHGGTSWGKKVWSRESRKYLELHGLPRRALRTVEDTKQPRLLAAMERGDITFPFRKEGTDDER